MSTAMEVGGSGPDHRDADEGSRAGRRRRRRSPGAAAAYVLESHVMSRFPGRRIGTTDVRLGERIRDIRLMRGISQTDLAKAIGVTFQQVQKYEVGKNRVSAATLTDIARALRVSIDLLLDGCTPHKVPVTDVRQRLPVTEQLVVLETFEQIGAADVRRQALEVLKTFAALSISHRAQHAELHGPSDKAGG